ncbi:MAG TPA: NADH-quinone oxidoreductase subunit C [Methylomirabilota bacterium]
MTSKFPTPPLADVLPEEAFETVETRDGIPTAQVPADRLVEVCRLLRDDPRLQFSVCLDVTAVDSHPRTPRFAVVYHLVSPDQRFTLRLRVVADDRTPEVPTISGIWRSADWQEREVWEMFGIVFTGHPSLGRLVTPDDWEGHPLRKDYPVQVKLPVKTYEPLQLTEEEFRANVEADRRRRAQ